MYTFLRPWIYMDMIVLNENLDIKVGYVSYTHNIENIYDENV